MSKIYLHQKGFPDKLLGRVTEDGIVYRSDPDEKIGYVEMGTGKIYISLVRPGTYAGRVQLETGKVFRQVPNGLDEYLGEVHENGKMFRHVTAWPDKYIGNTPDFISVFHSGAAFLLLVLPAAES